MCDLLLGSLATALKGSRVAAMCHGDKGHEASPPPSHRGDSSCLLASALQGKAACFVTVLVPRRSGGTMAGALQGGGTVEWKLANSDSLPAIWTPLLSHPTLLSPAIHTWNSGVKQHVRNLGNRTPAEG